MPSIAFEVVLIFLLLIANGLFAMSEIALVTARKSRLSEMAGRGMHRARTALEMANSPGTFLSTVQIGITLVGILAGAFGGGTLTEWLAAQFRQSALLEPYSRAIALTVVVAAITYFSLIIGELVPKRLALGAPERIAMWTAPGMRLLMRLCAPLVHLLTLSTDLVFRLFGKRATEESRVTEEEITALLRQGTAAGVFEETEQEMVEAVFELADRSARGLMTPRTQIVWLDTLDSPEQIRAKLAGSGHSRFPLCEGSLENVIGIVQAKDLLAGFLTAGSLDLKSMAQPADFVPRSMSALQLLEHIKESNSHIILVVDEYGGIEGLLTHHDLLEAIAGDMPLGALPTSPKAVQRKEGDWLIDGMMSIDEFKELFGVDELPGEKKDSFQTLGGFIFTRLGRIPSPADILEWNGFRFEIVDMDGKRIDKVLVRRDAAIEEMAAPGTTRRD